jgi:hypothetical protein
MYWRRVILIPVTRWCLKNKMGECFLVGAADQKTLRLPLRSVIAQKGYAYATGQLTVNENTYGVRILIPSFCTVSETT